MFYYFLQFRLVLGLLPALLLVLYLGMDSGGQYYEKSPHDIRASLKSATLPLHVLGSSVHGSRVYEQDENTVITALLGEDDKEMLYFVSVIEADGTGANVTTSIGTPEGEAGERAQKLLQKGGILGGMMDKLATEHVAAAIEERPFDLMFASGPVANSMLSWFPELQSEINDANANMAAMNAYQAGAEGGAVKQPEAYDADARAIDDVGEDVFFEENLFVDDEL